VASDHAKDTMYPSERAIIAEHCSSIAMRFMVKLERDHTTKISALTWVLTPTWRIRIGAYEQMDTARRRYGGFWGL
jgi:hypothetical protein